MSKDDYDDYSDDFISDDDDFKSKSRNQGKQGGFKMSGSGSASHSSLKLPNLRRDSDAFWTSGRGLTHDLIPMQVISTPPPESPILSDNDSQASSLEDHPKSKALVPSVHQSSSRAQSACHSTHLQSAHARRVSLSRGVTHTHTPASYLMTELTEETVTVGERETHSVPKAVKRAPAPARTGWNRVMGRLHPRQPAHGKSKANPKSRGRGRGRGGGPPPKQSPRLDYVAQRMLSAGRIKVNELRNQVEDQNTVIRELREENKLLKKTQHRHEKALTKYEDQEGDLPKLILQHNNETRTLKDQLRIMKEKYEKTDRYLRDAEDDLDRANVKLKKYKSYAENKGLPERDELNRKLSKAELDLEEKDRKIKELQRHVEHLSKNHRHELGVEIARHRETKRQLDQYQGDRDNLETKLKEKEKELEIKNIYSNRVMRAPHKLPASYGGTPLDTPPPPRRRVPSVGEMTAREKARMFEMKRREEAKKNKPKPKPKKDVFENRWNTEDEERDRLAMEEKERRDLENKYLQAREEEERKRERQRESEMQREQERQRELEQEDLRRERQRMKRESEELERREVSRQREQREREERERKEQEDRDRREREERDIIERENRLRRELKEREELERQAQAERERLENDPHLLEERRKKELLLARLKAIDNGSKENLSPVDHSPYGDDSSTPISRKSYSFSKPTENLHNGKPAYEEVSVPYLDRRKQQLAQDEDVAGYNPSFARRSSGTSNKKLGINESPSRKPNKKSALMDELFGNQSGTNKKDDDLFQTTDSRKQTTKRSSGFPWDEESKHSATASRPRENSSTLFGGGAALVEDDGPSDKSKLLPRRQRHQSSTFSSKPAVSAVDTFEDDIEEVML